MVEESVLIGSSITETRQFVKKTIPQIKGEIIKEDSRRIVWTYKYGLDIYRWGYETIECITQLTSSDVGTIITTTSDNYDLENLELKEPITKFHDALKQKHDVKDYSEIVKNPKRNKPKVKDGTKSQNFAWWKVTAVVGFLIFMFYINKDDSTSEPKTYITNSGFYATNSKEDLNIFLQYINDQDQIALDKMFNQARVFELAPNKEVFLVKSNWGVVKIRPKGMQYELWTVTEAIESK